MSATQSATLVTLVIILLLTLLALVSTESNSSQHSALVLNEWAVVECEQGNPDACQLERNLLLK